MDVDVLHEPRPVVYTAHSKRAFYARDIISAYTLGCGAVPLNPFRLFDYFLGDRVGRDVIRRANNNCVRIADETWVFGEISNGVLHEIIYARELGKPVRYFTVASTVDGISPLSAFQAGLEPGALDDPDLGRDSVAWITGEKAHVAS